MAPDIVRGLVLADRRPAPARRRDRRRLVRRSAMRRALSVHDAGGDGLVRSRRVRALAAATSPILAARTNRAGRRRRQSDRRARAIARPTPGTGSTTCVARSGRRRAGGRDRPPTQGGDRRTPDDAAALADDPRAGRLRRRHRAAERHAARSVPAVPGRHDRGRRDRVRGRGALLSTVAFRRIDQLDVALRARNAELEARNASARALYEVSVAIAAIADLDDILRAIVDNARRLLGGERAQLWLTDPDGPGVARVERPDPLPRRTPATRSRRERADAIDPSSRRRSSAATSRSGRWRSSGDPGAAADDDDRATLASLASQAAIAIEADRLQRRAAGPGRPRRARADRPRAPRRPRPGPRLREHEVAGRRRAAGRRPARRGAAPSSASWRPPRGRSTSTSARRSSGCAARSARAAAWPRRYGSTAAGSPTHRSSPSGSRPSRCSTGLAIDPAVEDEAFRIVREALTNVRKHAAAQRVAIRLDVAEGWLVVEVEDDGRGFDPAHVVAEPSGRHGSAWPAIRERAASVGGRRRLAAGLRRGARSPGSSPWNRRSRSTGPRRDRRPDRGPSDEDPPGRRPCPVPRRRWRRCSGRGVTRSSGRPPTAARRSSSPDAFSPTSSSWTSGCRAARASRRRPGSRPACPRDRDRDGHGQRGRGRPVRGDQGGRPGLPPQEPRGSPASVDDRCGRSRRGGHRAGDGGPDHRGVRPPRTARRTATGAAPTS